MEVNKDVVFTCYPRLSQEQFDYGKRTEGKLLNGKCVRGNRGCFAEHICSKCGFHGHLAEDHLDSVSLKGEVTTVGTKLSERKEVFGPGFMNPRVQKKLAKQAQESGGGEKPKYWDDDDSELLFDWIHF